MLQNTSKKNLADALTHACAQNGGLMSIADFMTLVLHHPQFGYYQQPINLGRTGDFVTSPHICSLFGEIIALWLVNQWQQIGSPQDFLLIELGPGDGTLLNDVIRVIKKFPKCFKAARIKCLEINALFRQKIHRQHSDIPLDFIDDINDIYHLNLPTLVFCNEFLDALPIHQFILKDGYWIERKICMIPDIHYTYDPTVRLEDFISKNDLPLKMFTDISALSDSILEPIMEVSLQSYHILKTLNEHIQNFDGGGIFIDYGFDRLSCSNTLQAIHQHQKIDVFDLLDQGGDLTAHVNFHHLRLALEENISDRIHLKIVTQSQFLKENGLLIRARACKQTMTPQEFINLDQAIYRLISPIHMGDLFKVLTVERKSSK